MGLPTVQVPKETVTLSDGQTVEVRSLTFKEYETLGKAKGGMETMVRATACATDSTPDEVRAWFDATPFEDVKQVVDAVNRISKMGEAEGKASSAD